MAGYDFSAWKSNNAVDAERRGLTNATDTASTLRRRGHKGITAAFVKKHGHAHEWHHTSSKYNETMYYSAEELDEWLSTDEGAAELTAWKAAKRATRNDETRTFGTVCWMEFEGRKVKTVTHHSFTGELTLRGSRVYFGGRYKSVNGNYISVVEHPADIDSALVHDVDDDGSRQQTWLELAVLADGTQYLLRNAGRNNARLLEGHDEDGQMVLSDTSGYDTITVTEVTDQEKATADALRKAEAEAAEKRARKAEEKRRKAEADPENRRRQERMWEEMREESRKDKEWRRLSERDETVHGTITWSSGREVKTHTGAITLRDGWAIFDYYPDRTTKIQFHNPNWAQRTARSVRKNLTITEHDRADAPQKVA